MNLINKTSWQGKCYILYLQTQKNSNMKYKLSMFNFDLPEKLIADTPAKTRDDSKLMVLHRNTGEIKKKKV